MEDLREKIEQHSKKWEYTKELILKDIKWVLRAILVIAILSFIKNLTL
jgi:hypothetical protein